MRVVRSGEGRFWRAVGSRRGVVGSAVVVRLGWCARRVVRDWGCIAVVRSVVHDVGVEAGVVAVGDWCLKEASGVGRTWYGWGDGFLEEGSDGHSEETVRDSWEEVAGRYGRIGSDDCSEVSTLDLAAIHKQDVGSLAGVVLHFGHNLPYAAMVRMDFHSWALALTLPEYFAARERSIRDTCLSEAECAVKPGH